MAPGTLGNDPTRPVHVRVSDGDGQSLTALTDEAVNALVRAALEHASPRVQRGDADGGAVALSFAANDFALTNATKEALLGAPGHVALVPRTVAGGASFTFQERYRLTASGDGETARVRAYAALTTAASFTFEEVNPLLSEKRFDEVFGRSLRDSDTVSLPTIAAKFTKWFRTRGIRDKKFYFANTADVQVTIQPEVSPDEAQTEAYEQGGTVVLAAGNVTTQRATWTLTEPDYWVRFKVTASGNAAAGSLVAKARGGV